MELKPFVCSPVAGKPDMTYLANSGLLNNAKGSWVQIAGLLGQAAEVQTITRKNMMNDYSCCSDVFQAWINNAGTKDYPVSWKGLHDVLCHGNVGLRGIADDLGI
jgi:hypothetical protein